MAWSSIATAQFAIAWRRSYDSEISNGTTTYLFHDLDLYGTGRQTGQLSNLRLKATPEADRLSLVFTADYWSTVSDRLEDGLALTVWGRTIGGRDLDKMRIGSFERSCAGRRSRGAIRVAATVDQPLAAAYIQQSYSMRIGIEWTEHVMLCDTVS
jgi:hypothetical protein